jgi:hypothetical protein
MVALAGQWVAAEGRFLGSQKGSFPNMIKYILMFKQGAELTSFH